MSPQYFVDRAGKLSNVRRTATGGMLVDATLARVGVMDYWTDPAKNPDKIVVRRYNPPALLAKVAADAATAPVTRLHPKKFVDVHNYQELASGHVVGTPEFRDGHIHATLAIQDAKLIRDIEMGVMSEVSMGYTATHDGVAGTLEDGTVFDEQRTLIEWNHIAIVPQGRAGKTVRLMLDSEDIPQEDEAQVKIRINGVEVDATSAQSAFDSYDGGLQATIATLTADKAALEAKVVTLSSELKTAQSDETLDAAIKARDEKVAAQKAADEKLARVKAKYPTIDLAGKSADFIDGLDARIEAEKLTPPPATDALDGSANKGIVEPKVLDAKVKPAVVVDARAEMRKASANAWRTKLGENGLPVEPKAE